MKSYLSAFSPSVLKEPSEVNTQTVKDKNKNMKQEIESSKSKK